MGRASTRSRTIRPQRILLRTTRASKPRTWPSRWRGLHWNSPTTTAPSWSTFRRVPMEGNSGAVKKTAVISVPQHAHPAASTSASTRSSEATCGHLATFPNQRASETACVSEVTDQPPPSRQNGPLARVTAARVVV